MNAADGQGNTALLAVTKTRYEELLVDLYDVGADVITRPTTKEKHLCN